MPGKMTKDEAYAFLDSRPGWIMLTTIGPDGYPHTVPIGYFRDGEQIMIGCRAGTQKLKNIVRNPRVSLLVESGSTMQDIKGVMIQGDAVVIDTPAETLPISREQARARGVADADLPTEPRVGTAYIRVTPRRFITWDYGR